MTKRSARRRVWPIAIGAVALTTVVLRTAIAVNTGRTLGVSAIDVVIITAAFSALLVGAMFWLIKSNIRAKAKALRRANPMGIVRAAALRLEDIETLMRLGILEHETKPAYVAVLLERSRVSWWTGTAASRHLGALVSETTMEYRAGEYTHAGTQQKGLIVTATVENRPIEVAIVLVREAGLFLRRPTDEELANLVDQLHEAGAAERLG